MKTVLKMILGLVAGMAIGLALATCGIVCLTDTTLAEFITRLRSTALAESMTAAGVAIAAFVAGYLMLIPIHEAGRLARGLAVGI